MLSNLFKLLCYIIKKVLFFPLYIYIYHRNKLKIRIVTTNFKKSNHNFVLITMRFPNFKVVFISMGIEFWIKGGNVLYYIWNALVS